jgi:hypothetical protein
MAADISVHAPDRKGDERNHHAHVMLTLREIEKDGFGKKRREWNDRELLDNWREKWAKYQNRALEQAGRSERVDHRSNEAQGLDKEPEPKLGPVASEMERKGKQSDRGDLRREVLERNRKRAEFRMEASSITRAIDREERKIMEAAAKDMADQYQKAKGRKDKPGIDEKRRQEAERKKAHQKGRFEEWANRKRAELQSLQHDRLGELGRDQDRRRLHLEELLEKTYGKGIRKAEKTLSDIEAREKARGVGRFLHRITGQQLRDLKAAEKARANLSDIESRMNEQRGKLERRHETERADLSDTHRKEHQDLENRIKTAYERREEKGWIEERPRRAADDERKKDRPKEGPDRERGGRDLG